MALLALDLLEAHKSVLVQRGSRFTDRKDFLELEVAGPLQGLVSTVAQLKAKAEEHTQAEQA